MPNSQLEPKPTISFASNEHHLIFNGLSFLLVLQGNPILEDQHFDQTRTQTPLGTGDIVALNANATYRLVGNADYRGCILSLPTEFCERNITDFNQTAFDIRPEEESRQFRSYYHRARQLLAQLGILWSGHNANSLAFDRDVLSFLMVNLKYFSHKDMINPNDKSISAIVQYIRNHYTTNISLKDIADRFYLSPSYFSRYFAEHTGSGFHDFLTQLRTESAAAELIQSDRTIDAIAFHNGFNSSRTLSRSFLKVFNMTPTEYRQAHRMVGQSQDATINEREEDASFVALLQPYLDETTPHDATMNFYNKESQSFVAQLTAATPQPAFKLPATIIIVKNVLQLMRLDVRNQLAILQRAIGQISVQLKLDPDTFLVENINNRAAMNTPFEIWDEAMAYLNQQHITPIIQIDEAQYVQDPDTFKRFCAHYAQRLTFGETFTTHWTFLFQQSTAFDSATSAHFDEFVSQLKPMLNGTIQFGLGLTNASNKAYVTEQLFDLKNKHTSLDFVDYSMNQNDYLNDQSAYGPDKLQDLSLNTLLAVQTDLDMSFPLYLSNWNTLTGQSRDTNGYFFRGALIAKAILEHRDNVAAIGFWLNTELLESTVADNMTANGISLFHYHDGRRPAFHALALLSRLAGMIVYENEYVLVVRQPSGYQILFLNPIVFDPRLSQQEQLIRQQERLIILSLQGIVPGKYQVKKQNFDMNHGALYFVTQQLMTSAGFDDETMAYITNKAIPELIVYETTIESELNLSNYLLYNGMCLYEMKWMG